MPFPPPPAGLESDNGSADSFQSFASIRSNATVKKESSLGLGGQSLTLVSALDAHETELNNVKPHMILTQIVSMWIE